MESEGKGGSEATIGTTGDEDGAGHFGFRGASIDNGDIEGTVQFRYKGFASLYMNSSVYLFLGLWSVIALKMVMT